MFNETIDESIIVELNIKSTPACALSQDWRRDLCVISLSVPSRKSNPWANVLRRAAPARVSSRADAQVPETWWRWTSTEPVEVMKSRPFSLYRSLLSGKRNAWTQPMREVRVCNGRGTEASLWVRCVTRCVPGSSPSALPLKYSAISTELKAIQ
jgi:hypothetical protein